MTIKTLRRLRQIPLVLLVGLVAVLPTPTDAAEFEDVDALRAARKQLAFDQRRIIANNDGCDCLYFPGEMEPSEKNFLSRRTTMLVGTQVDTISYCTISSGFGHFSHRTEAGTIFTRQGVDYGIGSHPYGEKNESRNITADLIARGTDPLQAVTGFAHENDIEAFWSFRMNDTHDAAHRPDKPYFLFPEFKEQHPEWLIGNWKDRTPHGRWSSVNYAIPEIRDMAFRFVEEVCQNYDVDGVEMDFFRHLTYFKSSAFGGTATAEECEMMTGLLRRIRTMSEEEGMKRGRPILIAVRVPDDADYCRELGLDVDQWMKEGLIDMLITTGYFRLHSWRHSVEWAHRYGVASYPALTDPRVKGGQGPYQRSSADAYRGRAARAWGAGADGMYCFNLYDIDRKSPLWGQLGDPAALARSSKLYFVTDVDGNPDSWLAKGKRYRDVPILTPFAPATLSPKDSYSVTLETGEDTEAASAAGYQTVARLQLDTPGLGAEQIAVTFNDVALDASGSDSDDDWSGFVVPGESIRKGTNKIEVELRSLPAASETAWTHSYDASTLPPPAVWRRDGGGVRDYERVEDDGSLLIGDWQEAKGSYRFYRHSWGTDPEALSVFEARIKIANGLNYVVFTNGIAGERLRLYPDKILLHHHSKQQWKMDTTDEFHRYRIEMEGMDVRVFVDDVLRIDAPGAMTVSSSYPRNEICFGGSNHDEPGTAWWDDIRFRATRKFFPLEDIALSVAYEKVDR